MFWNDFYIKKILLIVIESGLLAIILLFIGLWAKRNLEKFKSEQSLEAELNKLRVQKIGDCFAEHSKYAKLLNTFIESLNKDRESDLTDEQVKDKLTPKIKELESAKKEVEITTALHRFWLGDEIHEEALKFNKSFPDFCDVFYKGEFQRCVDLKKNMEQEMMDVDEVLAKLNQKIRKNKKRKR